MMMSGRKEEKRPGRHDILTCQYQQAARRCRVTAAMPHGLPRQARAIISTGRFFFDAPDYTRITPLFIAIWLS